MGFPKNIGGKVKEAAKMSNAKNFCKKIKENPLQDKVKDIGEQMQEASRQENEKRSE